MTISSNPIVQLQPGAGEVLTAVAHQQFLTSQAYRLQLAAAHMLLIGGFDELICLDSLHFDPFPYQIKAVQAALRRFRGRGMLCDEVGLGKTIEAGLVIKEYRLRQMAERILILTPPGLVQQWREELAQKFGLDDFVTNSDDVFRAAGEEAWRKFPHVIASIAAARLTGTREIITSLIYDLVVIDEAHHLKNRSSVTWKFVNDLQKRFILMLTATPVENRLEELYNLITILKPGQLKTPQEFRRQFVVKGDPHSPKNRGLLRELMADVMIRHSRGQVNVKLPPRRAHTVRLALSPPKQKLYQEVSNFVRQVLSEGRDSGARKLTLGILQREIGSSATAVARTLHKLATQPAWKSHKSRLLSLADDAVAMSDWAKADALLKILHSARQDKVLIFTHFQATLDALAERLTAEDIAFIPYHGGLTTAQKDEAIRRFENEGRVLLSTEAAGEGRNLQFCHLMVNFDLPWNPQRIEQRVGRIHRVGQTKQVEIFNLSAEGTIEDYLLHILDRKLNMFELVIGEMEMILGYLTQEQDFEEMLLEVWLHSADQTALETSMNELGDRLLAARETMRRVQAFDETLFGEDFAA
ncbi:MAG: DEAD/DEAH box helicase [Chloroflexi bacterium]|nr:DEAD/DEAH box helicase [Ardenticatenaceae bacterium]MBL1129985.1 DEAD/DEAH box helicase [Chloroflexota bacterium]NOG36071.1 DEAD/DEAH box helicase [Chloroflexota bacterium]GIK58989.1 MAG: putative ATP-dependent helicase YqhH [Chloroflexota bacterium]